MTKIIEEKFKEITQEEFERKLEIIVKSHETAMNSVLDKYNKILKYRDDYQKRKNLKKLKNFFGYGGDNNGLLTIKYDFEQTIKN